jgi:hypothetical protein
MLARRHGGFTMPGWAPKASGSSGDQTLGQEHRPVKSRRAVRDGVGGAERRAG